MKTNAFAVAWLGGGALLLASASLAAEPRVVASLIQPPGGLRCAEAVGETRVVFDFEQPRSDIREISVFVNGKGVPQDAVSQDWPRLTVKHGLHPGRNTVEVHAIDQQGKSAAHELVVLAGVRPDSSETDSAIVDCISDLAAADVEDYERAALDEDLLEDVEDAIDEEVEYVDEVVYVDRYAPRYVYYPYPAFSFIAYYPTYYYPRHYYHSGNYYHSGPHYSYHHHRSRPPHYSNRNVWTRHHRSPRPDRSPEWRHRGGSRDQHVRREPQRQHRAGPNPGGNRSPARRDRR